MTIFKYVWLESILYVLVYQGNTKVIFISIFCVVKEK